MTFEPPFLKYEDVGDAVAEFQRQYHPSGEIPVPIEEIIEFQLGIDIVPVEDLYRQASVNGFLSSDLKSIFVDRRQWDDYEEKYRFTLAHEVGHYVLHKFCYDQLDWRSVDDFAEFYRTADDDAISWFEKHGNWFAEQLLVPKDKLIEVARGVVRDNIGQLSPLGELGEEAWSFMAGRIARPFEVSPAVIEYRVRRARVSDVVRLEDFL